MENIKIYVANLGKYVEGYGVGTWVNLPVSPEDLGEALKSIGIDGVHYEEYAIHDYMVPVKGLTIGEYTSIEKLNEVAEAIEGLTDSELEQVEAYCDATGYDAKDVLLSGEWEDAMYLYLDGYAEHDDLAYAYLDEIGGVDTLDHDTLARYFDWEAFARDLSFDRDMLCEDMDDEDKEHYEDMDDVEFAEYYVDNIGGLDQLDHSTLCNYFDFGSYGYDMTLEGWDICRDHNIGVYVH